MKKVDLLIKNCTVLPMEGQMIDRGIVAIEGDTIAYVGKNRKFYGEIEIDGSNFIAIPGLVNSHTHLSMTLFRGISEDKELDEWLRGIWPLEDKLRPEDVYAGALLGCLEMIKSGTTCFADQYYNMDQVARAVEESGLRAVLASPIIEAGDPEKGEKMLKRSTNFALRFHGSANGRILTMLGPHATYTCSPELLRRVREEANKLKVGIHTHLAESKEMSDLVEEKYGVRPVRLLEKIEFLADDVLAAHCIHLTDEEIKILASRGVKVSYNPVSNMKCVLGIPKIYDLIKAGVTVGIGTDGAASNNNLDMFDDLRIAALLQKIYYKNPRIFSAKQILRMATIEGAKALGIDELVGSLEAGKKADVVLVDKQKAEMIPLHDPYATLVYSASGSDVDTVIVDGKIVMEDRTVRTLDEEEAMEKAKNAAYDLLSR